MNAFYWLAARAWLKPAGVWACLGFVAIWWLSLRLILHLNWDNEFFLFLTALLLNSLLKLWIAVEAGQRLAEDQEMGVLELLLSTPLSVRDILRGQWDFAFVARGTCQLVWRTPPIWQTLPRSPLARG